MSALHHIEAEQALLGALLFEPAHMEDIGALAPLHFYDGVHGRLFAEIATRIGEGRVADGMSLRDWSVTDPGMKELGGRAYLLRIMNTAAAMSYQVAEYATLIREAALARALKAELSDKLARIETASAHELLAEIEGALRALQDHEERTGADVVDASASFIAGMNVSALSTGIIALDERLGGLHRGELIIVAGRPSMGKTALAAQIARNVAKRDRAVHFASLEMPKEQIAARAISAMSWLRQFGTERVPYYALRNGSNVDRALLKQLAAELSRWLMLDDRAAQSLSQLERSARATRRRLGRLDLIVVDYLQLMRAQRSDGRVNEVTEISQGLKAIAKRLDCPVVALSQLSRGVEGRDNKRPTLADLRDSGAIEQDADVVLACYREAYYLERAEPAGGDVGEWKAWKEKLERCQREFEVLTLKQRGGPTGTDRLHCWLEFDVIRDPRAA